MTKLAMLTLALALTGTTWAEPLEQKTCPIQRDDTGKIIRSRAAIASFKQARPCPATGKSTGACPGWVIDHKYPLCAGGCDEPANMQWQRLAESHEKDLWEEQLCRKPKRKTMALAGKTST